MNPLEWQVHLMDPVLQGHTHQPNCQVDLMMWLGHQQNYQR